MEKETKWTIDVPHSEVSFVVKHLMIANVKGFFKNFDADIYTSGNDFLTAKIDFRIDANSVDTRDVKRDEHLRSADFFDVKNYPKITFTASKISHISNNGQYELSGRLTIKGITKQIRLNVEFGGIIKDPYGDEKAGFNITGKINRKDWGLEWNTQLDSGGVMVSEEVKINCDIELLNVSQNDRKTKPEHLADNKRITT